MEPQALVPQVATSGPPALDPPVRRRFVLRLAHLVAALATAAAAACGASAQSASDAAGTYVATTLTTEDGGRTVDRLAGGASIVLTLHADGSTTGRFLVPGGDEDGGDFDADLAGTWALAGDRVTLAHGGDTALRDLELTLSGRRLTAVTDRLRIVLQR